jgi:hypothetical protein
MLCRYQAGRGVLAVSLHDNDAVVQLATRHGVAILELERTLGFQWENAIQTWFIERHPLALDVLNRVYSWVHMHVAFVAARFRLTAETARRR